MAGIKMFCNVCHLSLNSSKQYLFHIGGKTHKRKEKEAASGGSSTTSSQTAPVKKIVRPNPIIRFVSSQNSTDSGSSQNNTQAVSSNCNGIKTENSAQKQANEPSPTKNDGIFCSICVVQLTSQKLAEMHYAGVKHKRAVALAGRSADSTGEGVKRKSEDVCDVCNVPLKSKAVAEAHYTGSKHEKKLKLSKNINTTNPCPSFSSIQSVPQQKKVEPGKMFFCNYCKVGVNSQAQFDAHREGSKHKSAVSGIPKQHKKTFTPRQQTFTPKQQTFTPRQQTFTPRQQTFTPRQQTWCDPIPKQQTWCDPIPKQQTWCEPIPKQQTFTPGLQPPRPPPLRQPPPPPPQQDQNRYFSTSYHFQNPGNYASPNMSYRHGAPGVYPAHQY